MEHFLIDFLLFILVVGVEARLGFIEKGASKIVFTSPEKELGR